ncbi:hypothetical protein ABBQ38_015185 [Trebouxia sp. C0009 RCD-2024]
MGIGLLLGSVIRGVTGFGSSIALLSTWVVSRAIGVRACTFEQLVLTDSLSALVASPPLLYVTNAKKFCDWRLVLTAVTFQVIGSPIGAYLLLHLDAAHLQLSIAVVLTFVFLSMVATPAQFKGWWQSLAGRFPRQQQAKHAQREGYSQLPPTPRLGAMQEKPKALDTELTQPKPAEQPDKSGFVGPELQILKPSVLPATTMHSSSNSSSLGSLAPQAPPPINISVPGSAAGQAHVGSARSAWSVHNSNGSFSRRASLTAASFNPEFLQHYLDSDSSGNIPARSNTRPPPPVVRVSHDSMDLVRQDVQSFHASSPAMSWMRRLQPDCYTVVINYPVEYDQDRLQDDLESGRHPDLTPSSLPTPSPTRSPLPEQVAEACRPDRMMVAVTTNPDDTPVPADADGSRNGVSAVMAEYKLAEHEKNRAWKILAAGSVAGTLSGLMGTLAGQPGPPLILMFALLKVPKEVVRATNAVNCCISPRLATYFIVGAFVKADWPLYTVGCSSCLVGLLAGDWIAKRVNQVAFSRCLLAMLLFSMMMLYVAGFAELVRDHHQ